MPASPSPSPSQGAVQGATSAPGSPGPGDPGAGASQVPGGAGAKGNGSGAGAGTSLLPRLVVSVSDPGTVSIDLDVILTNFVLTLLVVLMFGLTSALFNSTLDENRDAVDAAMARISRPLRRLIAPVTGLLGGLGGRGRAGPRASRAVRLAAVLAGTSVIYGFLSEDFALDVKGALLLLALFLGLGLVTYLSEGIASQFATRRLRAAASVELFGPAIVIATACVLFSRVIGFEPGLMYGFVASAVVMAPVALSRRQSALGVIVPALVLLAASLVCWVLLLPLRPAAEADGGWLLVLLASIAAMVFLAGLEGIFYSMIPISFLDGAVVFEWSRVVWALLFGTATFLFFELVINQDGSYLEAFQNANVVMALVLCGIFSLLTLATWGYFKVRHSAGPEPTGA